MLFILKDWILMGSVVSFVSELVGQSFIAKRLVVQQQWWVQRMVSAAKVTHLWDRRLPHNIPISSHSNINCDEPSHGFCFFHWHKCIHIYAFTFFLSNLHYCRAKEIQRKPKQCWNVGAILNESFGPMLSFHGLIHTMWPYYFQLFFNVQAQGKALHQTHAKHTH